MATIQHRRNIKQYWENTNPVLAAGELGLEVGVDGAPDRFKIGNGLSNWKQLKYFINEAELDLDAGRLSKESMDATYSPMKVKLKELWKPYSGELYPADDLISDEWVVEANTVGAFFPTGYASALWNDPRINAQSQKLIANNPNAYDQGARNNPTARTYGGGVIDITFKLHDDRLAFMTQFYKDMDAMVYVSDDTGRMRRLRLKPLVMTVDTNSYGFRFIKFKKRKTRTIRYVGSFTTFYQILFSSNGFMSRPPDLPMSAVFGDSYRDALGARNVSANSVPSSESYSTLAITDYGQMRTGWATVRLALGGSGWFNNGSGTATNSPGPDNTVPFLSDANVEKLKAFGKNTFRLVEIYGSINDGFLSGGKAGMKARVLEGLDKIYAWDPGIKVVLWGPEPFNMPMPGGPSVVGNVHDLNRQGMMEAAAEHPAVIGFIDQGHPTNPFWYGTGSEAAPNTSSPQASFVGMDEIHYNHAGGEHLADLGYSLMGELMIERERLMVT